MYRRPHLCASWFGS